jgi:hypothetical protein
MIDSGLFNGAGRFNGGPLVPYAVSKVTKGTRYRFRLINSKWLVSYCQRLSVQTVYFSVSARTSFIVSIDNRMSISVLSRKRSVLNQTSRHHDCENVYKEWLPFSVPS